MSRPDVPAEHYVAPTHTTSVPVDVVRIDAKRSNLWLDAWRDLRSRPLFWIAAACVLAVVRASVWPSLSRSVPADSGCQLANRTGSPGAGRPLGFTRQGCEVYSRSMWGTRTSLIVGVLATLISTI